MPGRGYGIATPERPEAECARTLSGSTVWAAKAAAAARRVICARVIIGARRHGFHRPVAASARASVCRAMRAAPVHPVRGRDPTLSA